MSYRPAELVGLAAGLAVWTGTLLAFHMSSNDQAGRQEPRARPTPSAVSLVGAPIQPEAARAEHTQVRGRVVDSEGHPVAGVAVIVCPFSLMLPPLPIGFVTDADGRFDVAGLAPGRYSFVAIHGHHPPGAAEAVPVFTSERARPRLSTPEAAFTLDHGRPNGAARVRQSLDVVEVEIVLDRHYVLEA